MTDAGRSSGLQAQAWIDPLLSWNDGAARTAIVELRANGYKTYIVTGGGQNFPRQYSELYGIPPEQVVGTAGVNNSDAGQPEAIQLMTGRRPNASFGNSTGDQQMLEYTRAGRWRPAVGARAA